MSQRSLARRLKRIRDTIQPPNSLAARVEMLSESEREIYRRWKCATDLVLKGQSVNAWEYYLQNPADFPKLSRSVSERLAGKSLPDLTANVSISDAAAMWKETCE